MGEETGKVKWTKNELALDEMYKGLMGIKILTIEGQLNDAYIAMRFCFSDIREGLKRTIKDHDESFYNESFEKITEQLRKLNMPNATDVMRQQAYTACRDLLWSVYDRLRSDLWKSGIMFNIESVTPPSDALYEGFGK